MPVVKGIFKAQVFVSFLMVGHTHDNIDASFKRWSMKLHEENFPTITLLMKSYIDLDHMLIIPHMIEEVPDFKVFIKPYMLKGVNRLVGHTKVQQFQFYMRDDCLPAMQFKLLYTSPIWGPDDGILIWHQDNDEKCLLPDLDPKPCKPDPMRNGPEIIKDISGSLNIGRSCVRRTSLDVLEILMNHWFNLKKIHFDSE
jgi:hypothetical protein